MKKNEKGQVLVLVALAIFVLLGFAALGIDVGFMYSVRHELQRSADAGALAGASAFATANWTLSSTKDEAERRAREYAGKDNVVQTPLDQTRGAILPACGGHDGREISVGFWHDNQTQTCWPDHIEVITSRTVNLFFARIFGRGEQVITARAVAQAAVAGPSVAVNCVKPWAITNPWEDVSHEVPSNNPHRPPEVIPPNSYYDIGPPGERVYTSCDNLTGIGLCPGLRVTLKSGSPSQPNPVNAAQSVPGHFFTMQGNEGNIYTGASDMRTFIRDGCIPIDLTQRIDLMTGGTMGPTIQGVRDLIGQDSQATWNTGDIHPNPTAAFPNWEVSPRVVRVVMYDPSNPPVGVGTKTYIPVGYTLAGFWVEEAGDQGNEGWVIGRYIPGFAFGAGGPPGPNTGTEVKVISLVE